MHKDLNNGLKCTLASSVAVSCLTEHRQITNEALQLLLFCFLFSNLLCWLLLLLLPKSSLQFSKGLEKLPSRFKHSKLPALSTYFTPTPHSICLANPSVTQTCSQWVRCVFYGHTEKVWRLQTKPQPCQPYEGRRGPFLRKSSQSPNNRAISAWGPLSGQWSMASASDACLNWPVVNKEGQI